MTMILILYATIQTGQLFLSCLSFYSENMTMHAEDKDTTQMGSRE